MDAVAGTLYGARLRVRGRLPMRLLVLPLVLIRNAVLGALGVLGDSVAPAEVEIFRLSDGAVVGEIPAGGSYYDQADLLASVRRGLETQTASEFLGLWGLHDA